MTDPTLPSILSPDAGRLALRVRQMLAAGRPAAARPMLRVLHGLTAPPELLAELNARLSMADGEVQEAVASLGRSIAAMPGMPGLHACRAEALLLLDDPAASLQDAAEAVILAPLAADAKALLGIVLIENGMVEDASRCLVEALDADPAIASYRIALAEALHRLGQLDNALFVLRDGIRLAPRDLALRRAAMLHAVRSGQLAEAVEIGGSARIDGVVDASIFGLTGHALGGLGHWADAFKAYAEATKLDPDDPYVRHLAAAGGAMPAGPCAPADYVRVVFDGYADRFDFHLISLGYRVPGLIRAALEALSGPAGPVTDLGCGTGLVAVACDDLAGPWTGVDLSGAMLAQARERGLYDALIEGEIIAVLADMPQAGLVLAGDVLCYFGALNDVLSAMARHLRPGSHAVVSLETTPGDGFTIGLQGRFRHSETHLREAAAEAGFGVLALNHDVLRWEGGQPVPGMIVTLQAAS